MSANVQQPDEYERFNLSWRGTTIEVSHRPWPSDYHHVELRCDTVLPVTETGYRSRFLHKKELELFDSVEAFVTEWLDAQAEEQGDQQLNLF